MVASDSGRIPYSAYVEALATLVAVALALHFLLRAIRRRRGELPRVVLHAQSWLAAIPLLWFAAFVEFLVQARIAYGRWPVFPRPMDFRGSFIGLDPTAPDSGSFPSNQIAMLALTVVALTCWSFFVPLAWNTRITGQTPRCAGFRAFVALQLCLWTFMFLNPGGLVLWAFD